MVSLSPGKQEERAVEPFSAGLRTGSVEEVAAGDESKNEEDCEAGLDDVTLRRISAGSFIDLKASAPREAKEKAAEHVWSDAKRRALDSWGAFSQKSCLGKLRVVGNAGLPCTQWMCPYDMKNLKSDIIAGCTVGVMVIPQSISYASLAGLGPIYGLYSALLPAFIYGLLGTSRELAVGPVAIVSLQVASGLSEIIEQDDPQYPAYCFLISLVAGVLQFCVGSMRLGFLINFLSHAVISGFTSGAAVIIGLSQVKYFLGVHPEGKGKRLTDMLVQLYNALSDTRWQPVVMGVGFLGILLTMKKVGSKKSLPILRALAPLTVVVLGVGLTWLLELDDHNVEVVGDLPQGLPSFQGIGDLKTLSQILPTAVSVTFVGILESVAIAKSLASKRAYSISTNGELIALGAANIVGSMFQAYPVTGSFSRSAVNFDMGSRTQASGVITACFVLLTLLFLTPWFFFLPKAALSAIVMSAVVGLVDFQEAKFLIRVKKLDFVQWIAAFLGTLFLGVETGIVVSVAISLVFVIYESAAPRTSVLGRLPGDIPVYRDAKQYPEARSVPGVLIFRVEAPIYFANVDFVKEKLRKYEDYHVGKSFSWLHHYNSDSEDEDQRAEDTDSGRGSPREQMIIAGQAAIRADQALAEMSLDGSEYDTQQDVPRHIAGGKSNHDSNNVGVVRTWIEQEGHPDRVRFLVLDLAPVTSVDSSAIHAFKEIMAEYKERGIQMVFSNPNSDVLSTMYTSGLIGDSNAEWVFVRTADAVRSCVLAMKEQDIRMASKATEQKRVEACSLQQSDEP